MSASEKRRERREEREKINTSPSHQLFSAYLYSYARNSVNTSLKMPAMDSVKLDV